MTVTLIRPNTTQTAQFNNQEITLHGYSVAGEIAKVGIDAANAAQAHFKDVNPQYIALLNGEKWEGAKVYSNPTYGALFPCERPGNFVGVLVLSLDGWVVVTKPYKLVAQYCGCGASRDGEYFDHGSGCPCGVHKEHIHCTHCGSITQIG